MHFDKRGHYSEIKRLGIFGTFTALGLSAIITIWAIYLDSYLHNASYVGFLTAFFTIIGTLTFIFAVPLIEKINKVKFFSLILILLFIFYALFSIISNFYIVIILGIITSIIGSLRISAYGILIREKSKDSSLSKNEGLIYTILNSSFFIAPIIAGFIASKYGIKYVFLFGSLMFLVSFLLSKKLKLKEIKPKKKIDKNPLKLFFDFFKDKNKRLAYFLGGGIHFWWVLIYVFVPIYMYENNLGNKIIGYFIAAIVLPLILSEYKIGKIASKKGFKKLFFYGYTILGLTALICFFITNIYLMLIILILASFGAAMIEPINEAYFFDIIKKKDREKYYPQYLTVIGISPFFSRFFSAVVLLIFPFKFIFLLFAIVMFSIAILSSKVKNIVESKKRR